MRVVRPLLGFTRAVLLRVLPFIKVFPTRLTDHGAVKGLLDRLHPVLTDKSLIRLGPQGDGGYLVPDDQGSRCCSLRASIASRGSRKTARSWGCGSSWRTSRWNNEADTHDLFHFTRKHLGFNERRGDDDPRRVGVGIEPGSSGDLMLQIDIEGGEYEVLLATSEELLRRFRIIVAEFHQLDMLFSAPFFGPPVALSRRSCRHDCVHIHQQMSLATSGWAGGSANRRVHLPPSRPTAATRFRHRVPPSARCRQHERRSHEAVTVPLSTSLRWFGWLVTWLEKPRSRKTGSPSTCES